MPTLFSETIGTKQKSSLFKYFEIMNKFLLIDSQWIAQLASIGCPELSLEKHLESEGSSNSKRSTLEDWLEKKVEAKSSQWVKLIYKVDFFAFDNGNCTLFYVASAQLVMEGLELCQKYSEFFVQKSVIS